jgi:hypothetical protein
MGTSAIPQRGADYRGDNHEAGQAMLISIPWRGSKTFHLIWATIWLLIDALP